MVNQELQKHNYFCYNYSKQTHVLPPHIRFKNFNAIQRELVASLFRNNTLIPQFLHKNIKLIETCCKTFTYAPKIQAAKLKEHQRRFICSPTNHNFW